jgi:hypothetical protein
MKKPACATDAASTSRGSAEAGHSSNRNPCFQQDSHFGKFAIFFSEPMTERRHGVTHAAEKNRIV